MSEIHWVKLSTAMFDDEKIRVIESMPSGDSVCLIWIKLITLAGRVNDNGQIYLTRDIPYTDDMLATICGKTVETMRMAFGAFKRLGMIDVLDDNRIVLVNWEKYQNIVGMERVRELTKARTQKYRERIIGSNVTVTSRDAIDSDSDSDVDIDKDKIAPTRAAPSVPAIAFDFTSELWEHIPDALVDKWQAAYPAANVERELIKAGEWLVSNPKKRKKNYRAFLVNWLARCQERGRG
jgi:predicted phage replisome organizer